MEAEPAAALAPVLRSWYHPMSAAPSLLHLTLLEGGKGDFLTLTCNSLHHQGIFTLESCWKYRSRWDVDLLKVYFRLIAMRWLDFAEFNRESVPGFYPVSHADFLNTNWNITYWTDSSTIHMAPPKVFMAPKSELLYYIAILYCCYV